MKLILSIYAVLLSLSLQAKLTDPTEVAKRKATDRTNNAIDRSIDKGLNKVEEGIGNLFKKKEKPEKDSESDHVNSDAKEEKTLSDEKETGVSILLPHDQT